MCWRRKVEDKDRQIGARDRDPSANRFQGRRAPSTRIYDRHVVFFCDRRSGDESLERKNTKKMLLVRPTIASSKALLRFVSSLPSYNRKSMKRGQNIRVQGEKKRERKKEKQRQYLRRASPSFLPSRIIIIRDACHAHIRASRVPEGEREREIKSENNHRRVYDSRIVRKSVSLTV